METQQTAAIYRHLLTNFK